MLFETTVHWQNQTSYIGHQVLGRLKAQIQCTWPTGHMTAWLDRSSDQKQLAEISLSVLCAHRHRQSWKASLPVAGRVMNSPGLICLKCPLSFNCLIVFNSLCKFNTWLKTIFSIPQVFPVFVWNESKWDKKLLLNCICFQIQLLTSI